jgi:hypothetical protein
LGKTAKSTTITNSTHEELIFFVAFVSFELFVILP